MVQQKVLAGQRQEKPSWTLPATRAQQPGLGSSTGLTPWTLPDPGFLGSAPTDLDQCPGFSVGWAPETATEHRQHWDSTSSGEGLKGHVTFPESQGSQAAHSGEGRTSHTALKQQSYLSYTGHDGPYASDGGESSGTHGDTRPGCCLDTQTVG